MWLRNPIESLLGLQCSSFRHYQKEEEEKEELRITQKQKKKKKKEKKKKLSQDFQGMRKSSANTLLEGFLLKLSLLSAAAAHHLA
jgi:hypothetical protein